MLGFSRHCQARSNLLVCHHYEAKCPSVSVVARHKYPRFPSLRGTKQSPCRSSLRGRNYSQFPSLRGTKQSPCISSLQHECGQFPSLRGTKQSPCMSSLRSECPSVSVIARHEAISLYSAL